MSLDARLLDRLAAGDAGLAVVGAPPDRLHRTRLGRHHLMDSWSRLRRAGHATGRLADLAVAPFIAGSATAVPARRRQTVVTR